MVLIRKGEEKDLPRVLELIHELAEFEKAPHEVQITLGQLQKDGFGERKLYEFIVAVAENQVVGMAFYYFRYSTWKGKFLYLEDFIVEENSRNQGIGTELFRTVMKISLQENCIGMTWQVLDWNQSAIKFYQKYGAQLDDEWVNGKLLKSEIEKWLK